MKHRAIIVILSAVVSVLVHFPELISTFHFGTEEYNPFGKIGLGEVASEIGYLFISLLLLFRMNTFIFRSDNKQQRIRWQWLVISFLFTWLASSMMAHLFVELREHLHIPAINVTLHHYLHPLRDFIISVVVTGGSYIIYLIGRQQAIIIENQELRTENIRNQYESLKNQLNPHMFFNSLNTLSSLIRSSPQKAQNYTYELSKVLRYTLHTTESRAVTLMQEKEFVDAYIYLLKTRYEDNIDFRIDIEQELMDRSLPPMAIQMLIENAVKHNEISTKKPMLISVTTQGETIVVSNPIQPKISPSNGSGIGLRNLNKRYELLFKQEIEINNDGQTYTVRLPLTKQDDERTDN